MKGRHVGNKVSNHPKNDHSCRHRWDRYIISQAKWYTDCGYTQCYSRPYLGRSAPTSHTGFPTFLSGRYGKTAGWPTFISFSMPSLKLKHLRLRSLASFVTSLIVLISLCLTISGPHIAYAADADSIAQKDHDHPRLLELINQPGNFEDSQLQTGPEIESYTPEFTGFDRSIIGRAGGDARELGNNAPGKDNINGGDIHYWTFTNKTLWGPLSPGTSGLPSPDLEQRDAGRIYLTDNLEHGHDVEELNKRQNNPPTRRTLYISLNTCNQPHPSNPDTKAGPPQLQLYISQSLKNQKPDKTTNDQAITVDGGFGGANVTATSDVWFSVLAPQSSDFDGVYSYELTASIDAPYASYYDFKKLSLIDSDINSALLSSSSMTNQNSTGDSFKHWRNGPPRLSIFVHNQEDPAILGLQKSVCGLKNYAQVQGNLIGKNATNVETSMTTTYEGTPVQRFYAKNLNGSSAYYAIMAIDGNSTLAGGGVVRGGGSVWSFINFTTKSGTPFSNSPLSQLSNPLNQTHSLLPQQKITAKSSTNFPSATKSPTPSLPTPTLQTSPQRTTITPPPFTKTSASPSSKSLATPPLQQNTPSPKAATTAITLTGSGCAPSRSHAARTSPPNSPTSNLAVLDTHF